MTALRAAIAVLVLLWASVAEAQFLSPGPLSKGHAALEGDQHCKDCHSAGKQVSQPSCLKCHDDLGARINAGKGLHGLAYAGKACAGCHVEHLGKPLVRWPGGDQTRFDHALGGWLLNGTHKTTPCAKCHTKQNPRGNATFLGLTATCTSCHKDPHDNRFGARCNACHDETSFKNLDLKGFNHDLARFPLKGAHVRVQCNKCHAEPPRYVGLKFGGCIDCHKDPHAGRLGNGCASCHEDTRWKPVTFQHGAARHPGTSLANGHASVACAACHDRGNFAPPSRGNECASCHKPVHKAPFGKACATCHGSIQWTGLPRQVGLNAHPRTAYPLTGKHEAAACAGCHKPEVPRESRYRNVAFNRCAGCHLDRHEGEFKSQDGGECAACHATTGFRPTRFGMMEHLSTSFPLVGKHTAVACAACHGNTRPHVDLRVPKRACADCHANPHGEQFKAEMAQGGCAQCHSPSGWSLPKIDHKTWPLTGAHAVTRCERCHFPNAEDRKAGKGASYRGVSRQCTGCHDDVHLGQFRLTAPVLECDRCHSTRVFKIPGFDHTGVAGWELTGAHQKAACAKCHPATVMKDGTSAARYRLTSHECAYCHANPHAQRGR